MTKRRDKKDMVIKISVALLPREKERLERLAKKYYRGNRSAAFAGILAQSPL